MSTPRSSLQLIQEILKVVKEGETKPTRISNKTNITWISFTKYLTNLSENGFLEKNRVSNRNRYKYEITEKGEILLKNISKSLSYSDTLIF
jgi:predicted transcriptional regulator